MRMAPNKTRGLGWPIIPPFKTGFSQNGLCAAGPDRSGSFEILPGVHDLWRAQLAGLGAGRRSQSAFPQAGAGSGRQFLRHGRHVFAGCQRGNTGPRHPGFRGQAAVGGAGDQGLFPHGQGAQSKRLVAQAYPGVDRRILEAAGAPIMSISTRSIASIPKCQWKRPSRRWMRW